mgnify:FL=1
MNSRMDKYAETPNLKSRAEKNKDLYEQIKTSDIDKFDIASNATVIGEDINRIDVDKVKDILDKRYRDEYDKRSLKFREQDEEIIEDKKYDTKEYDINAILEKAKKTQNVDYEKERLKKVHDTQYDILKKLNIDETNEEEVMEDSEENIVNLINTITNLELQNSKKNSTGNTTAVDLLSDLSDNDTNTVYKTMELDKEEISTKTEDNLDEEDLSIEDKYYDFKELEKDLKSNNIAIKVVGIVFVIILIILAIIFINKYFNLGLF